MTPRTISVERESEIINAIEETKRTFGNKTLGGDLHAELMAERAAHQETQAKLDEFMNDDDRLRFLHRATLAEQQLAEAQAISRELLESLTWAMNSGNLTYTQRIERQNGAYCDAVDLARARVAKARGVLPALPEKI